MPSQAADTAKDRLIATNRKARHEYEILETAEAGLQLAREFRPALILTDIELPGMSGIEALGHLRANPETQRKALDYFAQDLNVRIESENIVALLAALGIKGDPERFFDRAFLARALANP